MAHLPATPAASTVALYHAGAYSHLPTTTYGVGSTHNPLTAGFAPAGTYRTARSARTNPVVTRRVATPANPTTLPAHSNGTQHVPASTLPAAGNPATRRARHARFAVPVAKGQHVVAYGMVGVVASARASRRGNPAVAVQVPNVGTLYVLPAQVVTAVGYNPLRMPMGHAVAGARTGASGNAGLALPANGVHYGHAATYGAGGML